MKYQAITHQFVETIPTTLDEGVVYVSLQFATAIHKCLCGCGNEVVTPLSPTDWKITFDGESISLNPSIGNWGFPCMSHYWIEGNKVIPAHRWSKLQIDTARKVEKIEKREYFDTKVNEKNFLNKIKKWLSL